jgi:hypothetical protein
VHLDVRPIGICCIGFRIGFRIVGLWDEKVKERYSGRVFMYMKAMPWVDFNLCAAGHALGV